MTGRWSALIAAAVIYPASTEAQQVLPGISNDSITYSTDPFVIEKDALSEGLKRPGTLRSIIERETGLDLPGSVDGIYLTLRPDDTQQDTCQVICIGKNGGEPCFSTCGPAVFE